MGVKSIKKHLVDARDSDTPTRFIFVRPVLQSQIGVRVWGAQQWNGRITCTSIGSCWWRFEYADQPGLLWLILVNDEFDSAYCELVKFIFNLEQQ